MSLAACGGSRVDAAPNEPELVPIPPVALQADPSTGIPTTLPVPPAPTTSPEPVDTGPAETIGRTPAAPQGTGGGAAPQPPARATSNTPFGSSRNLWTTPVASGLRGSGSAAQLARLAERPLSVSVREWTIPVYYAGPDTPRYTVRATAEWSPPGWQLTGVPIPAGARPDPEDDAHMSVIDRSEGCVYDFWQARRSGAGWSASWVNATPLDGTGVYPDGLGPRAAGFSGAAGLIWPDELAAGRIDHALVFAYPYTKSGGPVRPATASDGGSNDIGALPIGAHVVLDPTLDLAGLGLSPAERTIAVALQRYGMILADTSGGFTIYAAHPSGLGSDPYGPYFGNTPTRILGNIPTDRLRVLPYGPQDSSRGTTSNRCNGR